jgi:tetratricopeptide (TPR) repeat protein
MRAYKAAGRLDDCRSLAEQVLGSREGEKNLAAFDLLAEALDALGDTEGALGVLQRAAEVVPSARRHRRVANSAYQLGDLQTAKANYQKAWKSAQGSVAVQPQDALSLAQTQVELGEHGAALKLLTEAHARGTRGAAFDGVALAIKAQAWAAEGNAAQAAQAAEQALSTLRQQNGEFAKLALGRAALATGKTDIGFDLFSQALKSDHEDHHVQRLVSRAMADLGHGERTQSLIDAARQGLLDQIAQAKRLVREGQLDEAVEAMTTALRAHPDNPAMLLECAQMNCLWLRRHQTLDTIRLDTVRAQLGRLERLLPGHERVARMQRYLRETLDSLQGAKPQA